jgi:hypothetical protein
MWIELYAWLEKYSGVSYDLSEDFEEIPKEMIFTDPYEWKVRIMNIIERLGEIVQIIEQFADEIPDYLPDETNMKKMITSLAVENLMFLINYAKMTLLIDDSDIEDYDDLINQIQYLSELVSDVLIDSDIETVQKKFVDKDEENDNYFTNTFGIHPKDLTNMKFTVDDIRETMSELLEEDNSNDEEEFDKNE